MAAGVADAADEEVVVSQGWALEAVYMLLPCGVVGLLRRLRVERTCRIWRVVVCRLVLRVEDNGPAGREDIVVGVKLVGFEVQATERRRDSQSLAVRQVDD